MRWRMSQRVDPEARKIADRHYSRVTPGAPGFVGILKPLVFLAPTKESAKALWVSGWEKYPLHKFTDAWQCTLFRNEGAGLSSDLITEAVAATRAIWGEPPINGMITMVDRGKTKSKRDPGYCYLMAGWRQVGRTGGGLYVLGLDPDDMPTPELPHGGQRSFFPEPGGWTNARSVNVHGD